MFGTPQRGANAYANVGMETGVMSASPHKLIVMLFEGAMLQVTIAIGAMQAGETAKKGRAISRAIAFVETGLRASLNKQIGGELALNLDSLYEYMSRRLLDANLKNELAPLEEVHRLLGELKGAWEAIGTEGSPVPQIVPPIAKADPLAPRQSRLVKA
ncbi:MAG TPA: flagellar export chaperone FliS [Burkholderiaceae bacterium]|jgi:flagellar protein FliS